MQYLSYADLEKLDDWYEAMPLEEPEKFKEILWKHGLDHTKGITIRECRHRCRTSNKVVFCKRVECVERTDREWIKGALASEEAVGASVNDLSLKEELANMSKRISTASIAAEDGDENSGEATVEEKPKKTRKGKKKSA